MWLLPAIFFPIQIPDLYAEFWYLYLHVFVFPSKLSYIYSDPLLWVHTLDLYTVRFPREGGRRGGLEVGVDSNEWVCAGVRDAVLVTQSQDRLPIWFLGPQGTWGLSSAEYPEVLPRDSNYNLEVNLACELQNVFIHNYGHELTQSGEFCKGFPHWSKCVQIHYLSMRTEILQGVTPLLSLCPLGWDNSLVAMS